ncbi:TPA: ribosome assembly factor SBDS, partial [Candidatus Bathyarchaeota archaeon]|nr:ribosome assembly factor SBDS [Candidatus Bathyarchaeota archaeon]
PEEALNYKLGKTANIREVLAIDTIYADASKGQRASRDDLMRAFGTTDAYEIAEVILKRGRLQITTDQRRRLIEEKRRRIITLVMRGCVDPRTNLPIPRLRIEQAMAKIRCRIDPFLSAEEQVGGIIDSLSSVIPIKFTTVKAMLRVPPQFAAKVYGMVKSAGAIERQEWKGDGSLVLWTSMPAGTFHSLTDRISRMTRGRVEVKELR